MAYSTANQEELKESRRAMHLEEIRDFHQDLINDLGINRTDFNMKRPFYDRQGRMVVGIFASEFRKEKGFYFELINANSEPYSDERTVYRIPSNPHFEQEYELNERGSYLVPVEELRIVNVRSVAISGPSATLFGNPSSGSSPRPNSAPTPGRAQQPAPVGPDAPYSEMTMRDYYAMLSGKPVSNKAWLNELIKQPPYQK